MKEPTYMNEKSALTFLLQESQKHLSFGTWKINPELDDFFISDELCSIFNLDNSKSYDLEVLSDTIYSEDVNKILELFESASSLGIPFESTFRVELDGVLLYFSIYCDIKYKDEHIECLYGFIQDITTMMLEKEKQNKLLMLAEVHIMISQTDLKGKITYVSQAFADISGYTKTELMGQNHNVVRHPDMPSKIFKEIWETIQSGNNWEGEVKNLRKDGDFYWVYSYINPLKNHKNEITGYQSVRHDITDKKYIEHISITDGLTVLYNRRHFNTMFAKEINNSRRTNGRLVFTMLDVDNFKKYNDTYGHQKGDEVLISIAQALTQNFQRAHDMVFRLGGEEFGILFILKEGDDIFTLVDRARQGIQDLAIEHKLNEAGVVTASFGVIEIKSDYSKDIEDEVEYSYREADRALYKAKENGRNKIELL